MSIATDLSGVYTALDAVLDDCNAALQSKGQPAVGTLSAIADKISAISTGSNLVATNCDGVCVGDRELIITKSGEDWSNYDIVSFVARYPSGTPDSNKVFLLDWRAQSTNVGVSYVQTYGAGVAFAARTSIPITHNSSGGFMLELPSSSAYTLQSATVYDCYIVLQRR